MNPSRQPVQMKLRPISTCVGGLEDYFFYRPSSTIAIGTNCPFSLRFDRIIVAAGVVPFIAMLLVLLLVRNTDATHQGLVRAI